ncbi:unnamed protein product [Acanthoscelides obtectus]|uniref:Uncharacterized protein n=1 Tax=Acanthoscelides obtectus TaxID=200917 RepID=A0A9P0LYQ0_ACAOB|nr:unnamed protein product [Acanthoscelides obtectus]CAK1656272.1 hypothetical protein AOBTE_LOCUS19638 [Acanthoscelides obtectus]
MSELHIEKCNKLPSEGNRSRKKVKTPSKREHAKRNRYSAKLLAAFQKCGHVEWRHPYMSHFAVTGDISPSPPHLCQIEMRTLTFLYPRVGL